MPRILNKKYTLLISFFLISLIYSCKQGNKDVDTISKQIKHTHLIDYVGMVDRLIIHYNDVLRTQINKEKWPLFQLHGPIEVNIILSNYDYVVISIEKSKSFESKVYVHNSEKNPQVTLLEVRSNYAFDRVFTPDRIIKVVEGNNACIMNLTFINCAIPFGLESNSMIHSFHTKFIGKGPVDLEIEFPGLLLYLDKKVDSYRFNSEINRITNNILEFEILENYVQTKSFNIAKVHPLLKDKAVGIILKKDQAIKNNKEYPLWEIVADIEELRNLAKSKGIEAAYADSLLNDPQYLPNSGVLLYYYANQFNFMCQWTLINSFLYLLLKLLIFLKVNMKQLHFSFMKVAILAANSWVFYNKPEVFPLQFWIIPSFVFLISLYQLYNTNLKNIKI